MRGLCSILIGIVAALPASATPIYLSCNLDDGHGGFPIKVSADEVSQRASVYSVKLNRTDDATALFGARSLELNVDFRSSRVHYTVDRVSLSIKREIDAGSIRITDAGLCQIDKAPARAF